MSFGKLLAGLPGAAASAAPGCPAGNRANDVTIRQPCEVSDAVAAVTPAEEHTAPGWPFVTLQIAAVMMFAAPSMSLATELDGFCIAAATWDQVMPDSAEGRYCASGSVYWLPMSTKGIDPFAYLSKSAVSSDVGVCR